jgi:hypothetical protein
LHVDPRARLIVQLNHGVCPRGELLKEIEAAKTGRYVSRTRATIILLSYERLKFVAYHSDRLSCPRGTACRLR